MLISISAYEQSSTYKFINAISSITQPLNNLKVTYFIYAELTNDQYLSCLVNNDKMIRDFINYNGLEHEIALSPLKQINSGVYWTSRISKSAKVNNYYKLLFKLNNTTDQIVYIQDEGGIRKVYIFGVLDPNYLNKEYLELFILYFNDKAYRLIRQSETFKLPNTWISYKVTYKFRYPNDLELALMAEAFLNSINAKYYKIQRLKEHFNLSIRETQCLEFILQNKIAKEIAEILGLSPRTTETYIDNLKKKLNCRTKQEIMLKFFVK